MSNGQIRVVRNCPPPVTTASRRAAANVKSVKMKTLLDALTEIEKWTSEIRRALNDIGANRDIKLKSKKTGRKTKTAKRKAKTTRKAARKKRAKR